MTVVAPFCGLRRLSVFFTLPALETGIMNTQIRLRLSVMMFLQYFIWSSWFITMGPYIGGTLGFSGKEIGFAYNSTALAAMLSPFFVGMVADRFFSTEKILGVLHLLGGLLLVAVSQAKTFSTFYPLLIGHTLCYMPTLALTNSISFAQMKDPEKEFPGIRVLGTISWICAGLAVAWFFKGKAYTTPQPFLLGAAVSILMGLYCFTLPHTPPTRTGRVTARDVLGLDALQLLKDRSFAIFLVSGFLICIPLTFYFSFTPPFLGDMNILGAAKDAAANQPASVAKVTEFFGEISSAMTLGQMSEIFFMLVMPFFFVRLGVKWMLVVGMFMWAVRYFLFLMGYEAGTVWPLYLGILLHGVCYDFFFVTAYIYVDKKAPETIRAKAQGFIAFVLLGAGMFVGANLSGVVVDRYSFPRVEPAKFQAIADPSTVAVGNAVKWDAGERPAFGRVTEVSSDAGTATIEVYRKVQAGFEPSQETVTQPLAGLSRPLPLWNKIWLLPSIGALVILALFMILFQYREEGGRGEKAESQKG
jgi:nucleoside transporter